jgi:hypothetical protein
LGQLGTLLRRPGQGGGGGGGGGGFGALGFVAQAFGRAPAGGGGGFGGGGPAAVASGDYLVSITVDGKTLSRVLRVERVSGTGGGSTFVFDDDDPNDP